MAETLSLRMVGERALAEVSDLVGCPAEGITGIRSLDEGWIVTVEVLEVGRVPATADVLASYDVTVSTDGEITAYHRVRRYLRAQVDDQ
jgi:hypothetical protein